MDSNTKYTEMGYVVELGVNVEPGDMLVLCDTKKAPHCLETRVTKYKFCCSEMKKAVSNYKIFFDGVGAPAIQNNVIITFCLCCGTPLSAAVKDKEHPNFKKCGCGRQICIKDLTENQKAYSQALWSGRKMNGPDSPPHIFYGQYRLNGKALIINAFAFSGFNYCPFCGKRIHSFVREIPGAPWTIETILRDIKKTIQKARKEKKWICRLIRDEEVLHGISPDEMAEFINRDRVKNDRELLLNYTHLEIIDTKALLQEVDEDIKDKITYLNQKRKNLVLRINKIKK
jgi:hypothetical protein